MSMVTFLIVEQEVQISRLRNISALPLSEHPCEQFFTKIHKECRGLDRKQRFFRHYDQENAYISLD